MDIITTINSSLEIVGRLREISKNIEEAEFNNLLADLSNDLADSKVKIAELKQEIAKKEEEIRKLKSKEITQNQEKTMKWGCYKFEGEEGLFCTACFDTKGEKVRTTRMNSKYRKCPSCKAVFGS